MFRTLKLFAASTIAFVTICSTTVMAQHTCPNCGRIVSQSVMQSSYQVQPTSNVQVIYEQPIVSYGQNVVQQAAVEQPVVYGNQIVSAAPVQYTAPVQQRADGPQALAERSANYRASRGIKGHGFTSGYREGVGWSTRSAADAIRNCCYSTTNLPRRVAVARGRDGWYATTLYLR